MAESASTGNSGTTSNGGPAAAGSQTSSNGSFSTGKGNNGGSNSGVGPGLSFGAGVGAVNGPSIGLPSFNNGKSGFTGFASSNFGQGWGGAPTYTVSPGADGKHTIHPDANGKHTVYATTKSDRSGSTIKQLTVPVMTVDEVYGKGNQSITESGDYEASSNEKSNVETSTFGKQDEISVTPVSVTEDKGLVNNDAIQSVEGLDFQQKDKANQEVMEAKKSRDEAEAEDNADGMRDQLKAVAEKDAEETETDTFQVGEKNTFEEQNNAKLNELKQREQELYDINEYVDYAVENINKTKEQQETTKKALEIAKRVSSKKEAEAAALVNYLDKTAEGGILTKINNMLDPEAHEADKERAAKLAEIYGNAKIKEAIANAKNTKQLLSIAKDLQNQVKDKNKETINQLQEKYNKQAEDIQVLEADYNNAVSKQQQVQANYDKAEQAYNTWKTEYWTAAEKTKAEEEAAAKKAEEAPTTEAPAYKAKIEATRNEINNAKDLSDEQKAEGNTVLDNIESAADAMNDAAKALAANPNDINAAQKYVEETARYNKALKVAKGNKALKNTNYNKTFTKAVADANDFKVTREDGTQQNYAEFAAEMATKSPELAKGLYEAKAKNYEENGHKVLAAIETAKSKMVMTWLGSKFTFADNQVRSQFNQMAKTDMRATYAAYNNVLNDPNATPEKKAEASAAIKQANSLMTASAALQASTGFLSGIGDGTSDGVYGVTDPGDLNGYQEALNTASNFAKITLGLGVTPGANEAYQNMYYLAGDKAKNSILFGRDFDGDGFALCQEYGNNAAVGMIAGAGELAVAVALMFNPATSKMGINLAIDSVKTFFDGLYGVQKEVNKSIKYSNEVLNYFNEAKSIAAETGNNEATSTMDSAIKQIEDFQLKSDEVGNLDNWLEGSGSNTADNGKFNQALSYDEWLKLIEADPVMQEYAKSLNR